VLEKRLGNIRPDVMTDVIPNEFPSETNNPLVQNPLLIEITITNNIDAEQEERIHSHSFPALEVNLSRLGGALTKEDFIQLLVEEETGKR
jgi:hypothetical protein